MPPKFRPSRCYNCDRPGHMLRDCSHPRKVRTTPTASAKMSSASSNTHAANHNNQHNHIARTRIASNTSPQKQSSDHHSAPRSNAGWKSKTVRATGAKKFPHVNSNGREWDGWANYYRSLQEEGKKNQAQRWIGEIPFDMKFAYMYIVTCPPPSEINPYKPDGLEFLSPILKEAQQKYKCFIWYLPNIYDDKPGFGLVGDLRAAMDDAATICEGISHWLFADAHLKAATKTFWLVKPVPQRKLQSRIVAVDPAGRRVNGSYTGKACYRFDGEYLDKTSLLEVIGAPIFSLADLEPGQVPIGSPSANHINALYLEAFLMKALDPLRYSREQFRLMIKFGTCISQIDKDIVTDGASLETFKDRLAEDMNSQEYNFKSEFCTTIIKERQAPDLQLKFMAKSGFQTRNQGELSRSVELTMASVDSPGGRVSVNIAFKIGDTGAIEKVKRWYMTELPRKDRPETLLQINMLDLQHTNLSYSIALEHVQRKPLKSPSRAQQALANAVFIDRIDGNIRCPSSELAMSAKVLQMIDNRTWTYDTGHGYLFDLTKSQVHDFVDAKFCIQDSGWTASVNHEDWISTFAVNTRLSRPGKSVDWLANEAQFFPEKRGTSGKAGDLFEERIEKTLPRPRGEGCKKLLEVLKSVDEVVLDAMKVPYAPAIL